MNLAALLFDVARRLPERPAVSDDRHSWNYRELAERIERPLIHHQSTEDTEQLVGVPAKAGTHPPAAPASEKWVPAFAGMRCFFSLCFCGET